MKLGRYILAAALLSALLAAQVAGAAAGFEARAKRPAYDSSSLELVGAGAYVSEKRRASLRITVCLSKRVGGQSFDIQCDSESGSGRRVKAAASVPGCVRGSWRTTVVGEAFNRKGALVDKSADVSRRFHC